MRLKAAVLQFLDGPSRWILAFIGVAILFWGYQESRLSMNSSDAAIEVDLDDIEAGRSIDGNHVRIGKHFRFYMDAIYVTKFGDANDEKAYVRKAYFPIVSAERILSGTHMKEPRNSTEAANAEDDIADRIFSATPLEDFSVLVKTSRFTHVNEIPASVEGSDAMEGMIVNSITGLTDQESDLIRQTYPTVDPSKLIILEEGRRPADWKLAAGLIVGGAICIGLAAYAFFATRPSATPNANQQSSYSAAS